MDKTIFKEKGQRCHILFNKILNMGIIFHDKGSDLFIEKSSYKV